jgi:hypothetical protein
VDDVFESILLAKLRGVTPLPLSGLDEPLVQLRCVDQAGHDPVRCDASSSKLLDPQQRRRGYREAITYIGLGKSSDLPAVLKDIVEQLGGGMVMARGDRT